MVRQVNVALSDAEYERLKDAKGGRTWKEMLKDGAEAGDSA